MVLVQDIKNTQEELLRGIKNIPGVKECISYQKEITYTYISKEMLSDELLSIGGLESLKDTGIQTENGLYRVEVPIFILDERSFNNYCSEMLLSASPHPGVILINTIWDNSSSNRRDKKMIPFIRSIENETLELKKDIKESGETLDIISVKEPAMADKLPDIREEFPNFTLIQIMSENTYRERAKNFIISECYFTILAASPNHNADIKNNLQNLLGDQYEYIVENKLEKEQFNVSVRNAYRVVIMGMAGLLVCIGLANVLSNTIGHIYQRKREFARYIAVGLSPKGVWKVLIMEALILGIKPILFSLLINIPLVAFALNASFIYPKEFFQHIPAGPIILFALVIVLAVGIAYYLGGIKIYKCNLVETIKDDILI